MAALDWRPIKGVNFERLRDARLQTHHAAQWPARAARAFVPPKPDDSHASLGWDDGFNGLVTHKLQGARIGLKIFPLSFAIIEGKEEEVTRVFSIDGFKEADLRAWLGEELGAFGLDARALDTPPPYKIPWHKLDDGATYSAAGIDDVFRDLAAWFGNADRSIGRVAGALRTNHIEVSATRCWPHHFDLAALAMLDRQADALETARSIGIGFSPGDENYGEPYFYVSPWPHPPRERLPPVPELGRWHTKNFTAAVAPAHRILAAKGRQTEAEKFLAEAVIASLTALTEASGEVGSDSNAPAVT